MSWQSQHFSVVFVALWPSLFTASVPASTASQRRDINMKVLQFKPACRLFSQLTVYCSWAITRPSRVRHNRTNTNRNLISLWVVHCPFSLRGREGGREGVFVCVRRVCESRTGIFSSTLYFIPQMIPVFLPLKRNFWRKGMQECLIDQLLVAMASVLWWHEWDWCILDATTPDYW